MHKNEHFDPTQWTDRHSPPADPRGRAPRADTSGATPESHRNAWTSEQKRNSYVNPCFLTCKNVPRAASARGTFPHSSPAEHGSDPPGLWDSRRPRPLPTRRQEGRSQCTTQTRMSVPPGAARPQVGYYRRCSSAQLTFQYWSCFLVIRETFIIVDLEVQSFYLCVYLNVNPN